MSFRPFLPFRAFGGGAVASWQPPEGLDLWLHSALSVPSGGIWPDASGFARNHTLFGNAQVIAGSGLILDGSGDFAEGPQSWVGGYSAISMCAWVNVDPTITEGNPRIMGDDLTNPISFFLGSFGVGIALFVNGSAVVIYGMAHSRGTYEHFAFSWDGTNIAFYKNGTLASTASLGGSLNYTTQKWRVGTAPDANRYLKGQLDDLLVFNRGITAAEVADIYQNSPGSQI